MKYITWIKGTRNSLPKTNSFMHVREPQTKERLPHTYHEKKVGQSNYTVHTELTAREAAWDAAVRNRDAEKKDRSGNERKVRTADGVSQVRKGDCKHSLKAWASAD